MKYILYYFETSHLKYSKEKENYNFIKFMFEILRAF
jgi:hypothetical protein